MARAIGHLSPAQVGHRFRLRAKRHLLGYDLDWSRAPLPGRVVGFQRRPSQRAAWPDGFIPLDRIAPPEPTTPEDLRNRQFRLVGETRSIEPGAWRAAEASQLWRYHLHYFEWAWALVDADDSHEVFGRLWRDWHDSTRLGRGDAWSPYVASLRAWAMCGLHRHLVSGTDLERAYRESLEWHAGFVLSHLELDVGGNHLVKNLKALIGLGVFLGDDTLLTKARRLLTRELPVQVLPDGGHFERSPSYHAQVLGDLIDIHGLLEAATLPTVEGLQNAVERMRGWLAHMLMPDDTVPLLRDCVPVSGSRLDALGIERLVARDRLTVLGDSGYVVVHIGRMHAVLDVGQPCPRRLPAHAQADSLNWVLHVDGQPVVVDTGTSSYQDREVRAHERSTAAHNTVEIDGHSSTEVFAAFRAGRRAQVRLIGAIDDGETITVTAEHDGYRFLDGSPTHHRTWTLSATEVAVSDLLSGGGHHAATSRTLVLTDVDHAATRVAIEATPAARTAPTTRAVGMGHRDSDATLHASTAEGELPLRLRTTISARPLGSG